MSKPRSDVDDTMMSDFMGRLDVDMEFKHDYPQVPVTTVLSTSTKPVLVLDLTNNGISNGIAMIQFRVWDSGDRDDNPPVWREWAFI